MTATIIQFPVARRFGYQVTEANRATYLRITKATHLANQDRKPDYSVDKTLPLADALRAVQNLFNPNHNVPF